MSNPLRIKICGVTTPADARQAGLLGADAVGLNFHPDSPRHVMPAAVEPILRQLPPLVSAVGVFCNQPLREVFPFVSSYRGRISVIQWHGDEPEPGDTYPFHFIPAFSVKDEDSLIVITRFIDTAHDLGRMPAAVLVDGHAAGLYGGTGQPAPWELLASYRPSVPLILAGGLTPDNVAEAVRIVRPWGVDVASGVESSPGVKDVEKMRRFIDNAREASAR
jgi:phosphoribosylanthranilate isomerase